MVKLYNKLWMMYPMQNSSDIYDKGANMSTSTQRLFQVANYVKHHLIEMAGKYPDPRHDPIYRWQHTLRVSNYGKIIAEREGANVELVVAACLLHDVAHFESEEDYKSHGRIGAKICRPFLHEIGYPQVEIDNIWVVDVGERVSPVNLLIFFFNTQRAKIILMPPATTVYQITMSRLVLPVNSNTIKRNMVARQPLAIPPKKLARRISPNPLKISEIKT